ncbi:carbohydrate ABC transporter substrate-binding protein, CUT1 family [Actinacidiphila yanglinensis]|uniref:Carbohydrate ABC transporter substrate-binding protein, CUT1 family n=1 Tax=Actinacidiphila yanglinensis TaxID=310779 RepID=A0A1H6AYV7_9ACTN|nr:extracellular solute-binding protein [Actinacidiphila yanglinensis]SEG53217.1 carbohydrate ABC transporter substrate-binding protein, CUT1 family [Actinacidiphila yanglinensis]
MRSRTSVTLLAAAACLSLGLTGCSSSSSGGGGATTTLTVAEWTNPGAIQFTEQLDAKFEKAHPGVKVKIQQAPTSNGAWGTLWNSLLQSKSVDVLGLAAPTQAGFAPSYTSLKPAGAAALIQAGQLVDLKNEPFMKNYDATEQAAAVGHGGGVYGVMAAQYAAAGAIWYKKDLLAKYHLSVPTTFQEFVDDCAQLKKAGVTPIFVSGKDGMQGGVWQGVENQALMAGKPAADSVKVSDDRADAFWKGTQSWTDPVYQDASARYEQVMKYIEPNAAGVAQLTAPGVWAARANDYPFLLDGSWDGAVIQKANPGLKLGFFTMPGTDTASANRVSLRPDLTWMVPTSAKHRQLAMDWLSMFSQPENYQQWLKLTGSVSTQPAVQNTGLDWMDWLNGHMDGAFQQLANPWVPAGAPLDAAGPDFYKLKPIGGDSVDTILNRSATAYRKSVKG